MPTSHGFDGFYGLRWSNDMEPARGIPKDASRSLHPKLEWWNCALVRNDQIIEQPTDLSTLTRRYTEEAIRFIQQNKKKPFFLYLAHTYPHIPLFASKAFQKTSPRGLYGDVVEELDWSVGQVLETLAQAGIGRQYAGLLHQRQRAVGSEGPRRRFRRSVARRQRQHLGRGHARAGHRLVAGQDQARHHQSANGLLHGPVHAPA